MTSPADALCARCGHARAHHTGCGPGHHEGSPHAECCDGDDPAEGCSCRAFMVPAKMTGRTRHRDGRTEFEYRAETGETCWAPLRVLPQQRRILELADAGMLSSDDMRNIRAQQHGYKNYADFLAHMPPLPDDETPES